ncbi:lipopolysaccharide biosynthesis protein [Methylocaldum sp. BRCS4]|jgi:succinoglycan biosynthesis transport protein ExoP|uniref:GumC family protein n=1 Tax=Methylocaldum sp. GT1BB TaxID=3438963 RepID=UPI0012EBF9A1|nr:lipopolysaccharide biosynthesis protein [Methylocaldum sp. BRCS4]
MEEKGLHDYMAGFKRSKSQFAAILTGILFLTLLLAVLLPPTYRSTATILIEEQEIPPELVRSTITTYATQRLQMISQRVMTRSNLNKIIEKFDLYADARQRLTEEEIIKRMRDDIALDTISADIIDPRTGRPSTATIAFTLAYDSRNPDLAQRVANEITSLYLEENLKTRTQRTAETSDFLKEETRQMGDYVSVLEKKLADFKEQNLNSLPEQKQINIELMDRTERELMQIDNEILSLEDRKFYLDGQLAQIKPDVPVISSTGERILSPQDRLKSLKTEYLAMVSRYSDKHPDVVKARLEIASLKMDAGDSDSGLEMAKHLAQLDGQLASLREKYSENHPDIVNLRKQISALEAELRKAQTTRAVRDIAASQPENPAYITLQAQRDGTLQDLRVLRQRREEVKAKLGAYESRLLQSPKVERQYLELVRDYENATARYRELRAKAMEAEVAEQLEKKSKGERFSIIEPPLLPEKPIKPNRPAIAFLGVMLAIAGGFGYVLLIENMDKSIRGAKLITGLAGGPPLAVIPYFETDEDISQQQKMRSVGMLAGLGFILLILALVHWLWIPLDVLWFRGLRKMDSLLS